MDDKINHYLKEIEYKNEQIEKSRVLIILRDDDFSALGGEETRKERGVLVYNSSLRIDYKTFKNATDEERENLILDLLLRSFNILEEKSIEDLEVAKAFIESCKH